MLAICFVGIWSIAIWMLQKDWRSNAYSISYQAIETPIIEDGNQKLDNDENPVFSYLPVTENTILTPEDNVVSRSIRITEDETFTIGEEIYLITKDNEHSNYGYLPTDKLKKARTIGSQLKVDNGVIKGEVESVMTNQIEITVSWFSILNSFFIIALANFFSKWWDSKYNPSASIKYGLGLIILGIGFGFLAFGSYGIQDGIKVSMLWLILAYLFHTMGELCLSPVGLSYVSKLVPPRMIAFMFGMWYLVIAIGNKLAAILGGQIENITHQYSLSTFFLIVTIVPAVAGFIVIALNPIMKKLMHGVR